MGLVPCPLPCRTYSIESESNSSNYHLHSDPSTSSSSSSSSSSISSQPSLASVPSLSQHVLHQAPTNQLNCIATLKSSSSSSYVSSLVLTGKFLYTGSSDGEIRSCTSRNISSNPSKLLSATNSTVKSLVIVDDKIFSAHQDHKIRVWQVDCTDEQRPKCKCIATLPTLKDRLTLPRLFSSNSYAQVRRHKKLTWVHHADAISALAVSKDKSLLYSASWDRTFKIWRTSDFKCLESVSNAHDDAINAIAVSDDGSVYTGSADKKIKVWKKHAGEKHHGLVESLEKHKSAVNALAFGSDGSVLYSGACDRSILVWERESGGDSGNMVVVGALRGHTKAILCLAVVGDLVCSGSADCSVRIWRRGVGDDRSYSCLGVLEGHRRPVKCLTAAVDCDGEDTGGYVTSFFVYSSSLDCDIKVWQIQVPLASSF